MSPWVDVVMRYRSAGFQNSCQWIILLGSTGSLSGLYFIFD